MTSHSTGSERILGHMMRQHYVLHTVGLDRLPTVNLRMTPCPNNLAHRMRMCLRMPSLLVSSNSCIPYILHEHVHDMGEMT
jgi:hypothetical protein